MCGSNECNPCSRSPWIKIIIGHPAATFYPELSCESSAGLDSHQSQGRKLLNISCLFINVLSLIRLISWILISFYQSDNNTIGPK